MKTRLAAFLLLVLASQLRAAAPTATLVPIAPGWTESSINAVVFRHSPLATFHGEQFAAFYDPNAHVVLAKRKTGDTSWQVRTTALTGNAKDAHNTIAIAVDSAGILHMAWDHHGNALNYVQNTAPGSLDLTDRLHTDGTREDHVTYPEFYNMPDGSLLLTYRVGTSGNGDLVLKRYWPPTKTWTTVQPTLIAGEGRQNAYTELCVDAKGSLHIGWVWRSSGDVATNHNICYARSSDGGNSWTTSAGIPLQLPITAATAEIAVPIPPRSSLINQTTIAADDQGHPYIATYFKSQGATVPQYMIVYHDGTAWHSRQVAEQKTPFTLGGSGTQRSPLSRPLILVGHGEHPPVHILFRDADRGDRISLATTDEIATGDWTVSDLTSDSYDAWEPTYDAQLWTTTGRLNILAQKVSQTSGADNRAPATNPAPTTVSVLEVTP